MSFEEMESSEVLETNSTSTSGCGCQQNCVCQVVRAIKDIQDEAVEEECFTCTSNCFVEPLGELALPARQRSDTRVFTLTNKNGDLFKALFKGTAGKCVSVFFRVEDIFDNCCATLRVLVPLKDTTVVNLFPNGTLSYEALCSVNNWASSNSCITVDLHCFCAVQCIADVNLGICEV